MNRNPKRILWAVTVLVAAFLIAPEAALPGWNTADGIVFGLPFLFLWAVWPWMPHARP